MFKFSLKRFIATILVVAMIFTSTGFAIFAESIDDMDITMSSAKESSSSKYHEEDLNEQVLNNDQYDKSIFEGAADSAEVSLASPSYTEGEEDYSGEYEEEPEDDETTTITESETAEIDFESELSSAIISSEEETSTAGESNLVDANDITSEINIDEQIDTNIVETENNEIATISIVDEGIVNLVKINDEIASSSNISNGIEEKATSILATESETILDIEKSSESEINVETVLSFFGDAPLFGTAAPDTIWLGTYPQSATWQSDGSTYNIVEPIKWRKLSESGTEALYVADKLLDNVSYHVAGVSVTWGTSDIRSWINDTSVNGFVGKAFTTNQLDDTDGIVLEKTITTTGSDDTNDKAFVLSIDDANNLFVDDNARKAQGTAYAKSVVNDGSHIFVDDNGNSRYWLRNTTWVPDHYNAYIVLPGGTVAHNPVDAKIHGVRPAIYLNLSSPLYKTSNNGVSWDLNGGAFNNVSTLWNEYTSYFGGQALPTAYNFTPPTGKYFVAMSVNAEKSHIATLSIPDNQDGDVTLEALWGETEDDKSISYDFGAGSISDWSLLPRVYTPGTVKSLPNRHNLSTYVTHPSGYPFTGFAKSGTTDIITEIADTETENITLVPIWGPYIEYYESASDTIATASILRNTDGSGTIATYPWDVKPSWTRTGYDFVQWRDKTTGVAITDLNIVAGNMNDIEVYPEWREHPLPPDTIWLGTYPQGVTWQSDGSTYNIVEPIKWRRLSYTDTEVLYVADKILDNVSYHTADENTTWADSGIHTWLNDTTANGFIGKAFTTNQLDDADGIVLEKTITTNNSADTNDKAFLLSQGEAENLFSNNSARRVSGTEYAKTVLNDISTLNVTGSYSPWWLRTPGTAGQDYAMHVSNGLGAGSIFENGAKVIGLTFGVRPAIYINLESPLYKTSNNGVSWDLNGGSFANGSVLWSSMNTYLGGQLLPVADNFIAPTGKYFIGMSINTETQSSINTIIPDDQEGNIILKPLFGDNVNDKIINYDFGSGTFTDWSLLPVSYTPGTAKSLPTKFDLARYITPPVDQEFKGFAKSGTTDIITEIAGTETNDINLVAIYGDRPTITWNMGTGTLDPEVASTSYISGIEWPLPLQDKVTPPIGCEFDHWILRRVGAADIEPATSIPATMDANVEVIAVYNHLTYDITWNLADGTSTEEIDRGSWNGAEGPATYTYGNGIANLPTNVTPPQGRTFDHWKLIQTETGGADINPATSVSSTQVGDITIKAVYNKISYPITWNINGATIDEALMPAEHTYGTAIPLPNATNVAPPEGKVFNYWLVNGTKATSISANLVGNVTVTLVLKDKGKDVNSISILTEPTTNYNVDQYFNPAGLVLRVNYIDGSFANIAYSDANAGEFTFEPTLNTKLTTDITNVSITYEGKTTVLNITVNGSPSPYYPPSGGGGSSGGSGGGGGVINAIQNQIVTTTYIDQIKIIKTVVNSNDIAWTYDPIANTFKMNITTNGQTVPANSGFYLINNVVEQNINNTIINNISTNTYYFDKDGNMLTGWVKTNPDNKWYFLENAKTVREGSMVFGWYKVQNDWYYFDKDGAMLVNTTTPDGYAIGSDGRWIQ